MTVCPRAHARHGGARPRGLPWLRSKARQFDVLHHLWCRARRVFVREWGRKGLEMSLSASQTNEYQGTRDSRSVYGIIFGTTGYQRHRGLPGCPGFYRRPLVGTCLDTNIIRHVSIIGNTTWDLKNKPAEIAGLSSGRFVGDTGNLPNRIKLDVRPSNLVDSKAGFCRVPVPLYTLRNKGF